MGAGGSSEREVTLEEEDDNESVGPSIKVRSVCGVRISMQLYAVKGYRGFCEARVQHDHWQRRRGRSVETCLTCASGSAVLCYG